jgi:hypothetical protein
MTAYDPNARIIACGGSSFDQSWNQSILDNCAGIIDYISVHHYESASNYATGPGNYENHLITLGNMIAASSDPNVKIFMSEWNAQSTDWRTGLYAGGLLNVFERQSDYLKIGTPALFLRHVSATDWDNAFINFDYKGWFPAPNYVVMKLWHDHYAPYLVQTTGGYSDLNTDSTLSEDETTLNFKVVNPTTTARSMALVIDNSFVPTTAYLHYVAPGSLDARNTLDNPDTVHVGAKVVGINGQTIRFLLPAYSAGVVTIHSNGQPRVNYLFSYFEGSGDGLHLAHSANGLTWTALNNDATLLTPTIGGGLFRDPCITRGPDGAFHMVWTTGWWDKGIGIAHSSDLINWPTQTFLPVMQSEANAKNCWAPEIFYDEENQRYLIFWATTIDGAFPETYDPADDNNHRIYYVTTQDFVTYTPTALFYNPGFNCIDATIVKDGSQYVMFIKNETKVPTAQKNIRMATASVAAGPYGAASASITPSGVWAEGPTAIKMGQTWWLYYDAYTEGRMRAQTSTDLQTWTDITGQLSFPSGVRHGTIFTVPTNILIPLQQL